MGFIYMLTSPYGKPYIGQTTRPIEERFQEHQKPSSKCVAIYNAIQYHGWENFEKHWYEVPDEVLNDHEELMVEVLGTLAPGGYNLKEGGGSGGKLCEEVKKKLSESKQGEKNPMYGQTMNYDHKQKISKALIGKTKSDDHKQKLSESLKGKTKSDDHKRKMSESTKGEKNHMYGKTMSDCHKQKIREALSGDKNPTSKNIYQYGLDGTFVRSFASIGEAARSLNKSDGINISRCARGDRKSAYGFKWSYTKL
ncbi:GIY-YIG catalytic domain-containing endonuclease [Acanthocystis turfacea Chlorella virus NTS-1]|nr:GIY-YIG catalytic domain-containing endonuclease [Acanthocystis turfacea Chlorella virus NTS-1]